MQPKAGFLGYPKPAARPGLGHMELIAVKRAANGDAGMVFTPADFDWSDFDLLEFHLVNWYPVTDAAFLQALVSTDGGGTYKSASYVSLTGAFTTGAAVVTNGNTSTTAIELSNATTGQTNNSAQRYVGVVELKLPWLVGTKMFLHRGGFRQGNGSYAAVSGMHEYEGTQEAINGIKFFYSGGAIAAGVCYAMGLRRFRHF